MVNIADESARLLSADALTITVWGRVSFSDENDRFVTSVVMVASPEVLLTVTVTSEVDSEPVLR